MATDKSPLPSNQNLCALCGAAPRFDERSDFCRRCSIANRLYRTYGTGQHEAVGAVNYAVRQGLLKAASEHSCIDCGNKADHYEHRDYNKPLEVEPVCRSCNGKRGNAIPKAMPYMRFLHICSSKRGFKQYLSPEAMEPIRRLYWPEEEYEEGYMPRAHKPHTLLDTLRAEHQLKNDFALVQFLGLTPPAISKVRHGANAVSAELMIRIHECTGMPIKRIKQLAGQA